MPEHSTPLLKFSEAISQSKGFLTMASFVPPDSVKTERNTKGDGTEASRP